MPLEIIGAGFGRTGTHSLYLALGRLGFKTHHFMEFFINQKLDPDVWRRAYDDPTNHEDEWEKVYGEYRAAVDFPTCDFYKELSERYPNAKVILTVRSPESWYESICNTIYKDFEERSIGFTDYRKKLHDMTRHVVMDGLLEKNPNRLQDKEYMCQLFADHIEQVKKTIPKEKLLILNLGQHGWEPLCEFLDIKDIPTDPYPHSNSTKQFTQTIERFGKEDVESLDIGMINRF
ncbi:P-loop containing nucleoside triphosphate hydrolase protein [Cunninghamella echinulata]|nr:P-loop containing nucleoside triphosphate hydrolase protein [Cunninghamella echinulata]